MRIWQDERKNRIVKQIGKELDERNKLQQQRNIGASKYENYKRLGELDGTYLSKSAFIHRNLSGHKKKTFQWFRKSFLYMCI